MKKLSLLKYIIPTSIIISILVTMILFPPKLLYSTYQHTQAASTICHESDMGESVASIYLDTVGNYDYYAESSFVFSDYTNFVLVKKQGEKAINTYNLKQLDYAEIDESLTVVCGFVLNGYLYFTLDGSPSIYRCDLDLTCCEVYYTPEKFGHLSDMSLCAYNNKLLYLTDAFNLVVNDGSEEEKIGAVTPLKEIFLKEEFTINEFGSYHNIDYCNYSLCSNGSKIYFALDNKLFVSNNGKDFREIKNITYSMKNSFAQDIYRIKKCKGNNDWLEILCCGYSKDRWSYRKETYLYNSKTGFYIKFRQTINNRYPKLDDESYAEYVKSIS